MAKTWLITGTSSGFGREMTEILLARGDRVAATVRRSDAIADLRAQYGDRLWVRLLDVTDTDGLRETVNDAFAALGRIDVVVSNAGYGLFGAAEELTDEQIQHQLDTNLVGSIQLARAVIPHLRAQGGGHFMQVSSMGGQVAFPTLSRYHATKWGIEGFLEAVAAEVAGFGIKVTIVEPGGARTNWAGSGATIATPLDVYADGAVGQFRKFRSERPVTAIVGDPRKMAVAMIAAGDSATPPLRLTLGSDAYNAVRAGLTRRLEALEAQKDIALSTDFAA